MPKTYENKANHNQDFLDSIHNDYPDSYYDWKVTVQFYTALHRCYCVILNSGVSITSSHQSNISNLGKINKDLGKKLFLVYKNSRQSRYEGFMNEDSMNRINKINFDKGQIDLKKINSLVSSYYPVAI
tara:strand:+ start:728 stop:1111 length:384 start_codon:yes stop_codon:yes gene_type:complete